MRWPGRWPIALGAVVALGMATATAAPSLHLADRLAPPEAERVRDIVERSFASTRVEIDPYVTRPDIWEYMLDHPEFATHVTRALKLARYRVWEDADGLWLDDGWGVRGRFTVVHAEPGRMVVYGRGSFSTALLPEIHGEAVASLEYAFRPGGEGYTVVATVGSAYVQTDSRALNALGRLAKPLVQARADLEARRLLRTFARASRAIREDPAHVYQVVSVRPDVPQRELGEFRRMLGLR